MMCLDRTVLDAGNAETGTDDRQHAETVLGVVLAIEERHSSSNIRRLRCEKKTVSANNTIASSNRIRNPQPRRKSRKK